MKFDGDLSSKKQLQVVKISLLRLASLLVNGDGPISEITTEGKVSVNLAQLIRINAVKANCRPSKTIQHSVSKELSFLIKIGMTTHAKTRKRLSMN